MKKVIFSIIFSLVIALGASSIQAAVTDGNVAITLDKGDDDKKKKKKCSSAKKKCCAKDAEKKSCSPKTEDADTK